ncbi:MAG: tRNA pseudouridine(55) synthase TruB [Clostridia bacterium]|nr:tRNA pseudouridine(55) synthase TruB [Clostridia bacterium]
MEGILIINKPKGFTSQDVVSKTKKILNVKKAGHTGTLDPQATGVLPVLIGNYTKLSKYLIEHDKIYQAKIQFGEKRETGDLEGKVIQTCSGKVKDIRKIKEVLRSMIGKQMQVPPMYSAIKVNGKKLYEYARAGEEVSVPAREIEIYQLDFVDFKEEVQILEIKISCSKGTYIRTLCEDIAEKLGTVRIYVRIKSHSS